MPFTTEIKVAVPNDEHGTPLWRVLEPLNFHSEKFSKHYVVPAGFLSDLASVPRVPILWLVAGRVGNAAAIVHDWLYNYGVKFKQIADRAEADEIFFEAMVDCRVPLWRAWAMFGAVRLFGAANFKDRTGAVK